MTLSPSTQASPSAPGRQESLKVLDVVVYPHMAPQVRAIEERFAGLSQEERLTAIATLLRQGAEALRYQALHEAPRALPIETSVLYDDIIFAMAAGLEPLPQEEALPHHKVSFGAQARGFATPQACLHHSAATLETLAETLAPAHESLLLDLEA